MTRLLLSTIVLFSSGCSSLIMTPQPRTSYLLDAQPHPTIPLEAMGNIQSLDESSANVRMQYDFIGCTRLASRAVSSGALGTAAALINDCTMREHELIPLGNRIADLHPNWPLPLKAALKMGQPFALGMRREIFNLLVLPPDDVNTSVTLKGTRQQLVYNLGHKRFFFYFDNGILSSYQV